MKGYKTIDQFNLQECISFLRNNIGSEYESQVKQRLSKLKNEQQKETVEREKQKKEKKQIKKKIIWNAIFVAVAGALIALMGVDESSPNFIVWITGDDDKAYSFLLTLLYLISILFLGANMFYLYKYIKYRQHLMAFRLFSNKILLTLFVILGFVIVNFILVNDNTFGCRFGNVLILGEKNCCTDIYEIRNIKTKYGKKIYDQDDESDGYFEMTGNYGLLDVGLPVEINGKKKTAIAFWYANDDEHDSYYIDHILFFDDDGFKHPSYIDKKPTVSRSVKVSNGWYSEYKGMYYDTSHYYKIIEAATVEFLNKCGYKVYTDFSFSNLERESRRTLGQGRQKDNAEEKKW